jgi:hypothetical protein
VNGEPTEIVDALSLKSGEMKHAVTTGVENAMWQMITNATQMPCRDFFDTVGDAVERAMSKLENGALTRVRGDSERSA